MSELSDVSGRDALARLVEGANLLGLSMTSVQEALFIRYCDLILDANARFNITGVKTADGIMSTLFLDSLTVLWSLQRSIETTPMRVVDIGTGAGIPGLPMRIMSDDLELCLVEATGKKSRFLERTVENLGLTHVSVVSDRAESLGRQSQYRDQFTVAVARAVAPLAVLLEYCCPFVEQGGWLAFPKSGNFQSEVASAQDAASALGTKLSQVMNVPASVGLGSDRAVLIYRKVEPTPSGYPRRMGLARARPAGTPAKPAAPGPLR